ncbi:MAG: hypothetical protein WDA27_11335 [Actinomycetota bacterium]
MDPWDHIRRAAADKRSGAVEIAARAAQGVAELRSRREVLRAARALLRAHPTMAPLWRLLTEALEGADTAGFAERLEADAAAAADAVRWIAAKRGNVVLTHSSSSGVVAALESTRHRVDKVLCTASLPGGEGRTLARRLERAGFCVEVVPDAGIARACERATVALVGSDSVTEQGVVNKLGTKLVALAARDAQIGCYAIGAGLKMLPARALGPELPAAYELTPLELFDAVLTERGPLRPAAVRRAVARVAIPEALEGKKR